MAVAKRWYDTYEPFAIQLERLKTAPAGKRDRMVADVLEIICTDAPELLENYLMDFPLDQKKRRWYDLDPYLWLMVNGLEHAGLELLKKVTVFMERSGKTGMKKAKRGVGISGKRPPVKARKKTTKKVSARKAPRS